MNERRKLWISMSVALFGTTALAAGQPAGLPDDPAGSAALYADGEGEGTSGEGEGYGGEGEGEGEGGGPADLKADDAAYLVRLGLIRGHLLAGYELYSGGHADMARTHMKHPRDELYAGLVPAIEHRGGEAFDAELSALSEKVEAGADPAEVEDAYRALVDAIRAAEAATDTSLKSELLGVMGLLRTAGEEYAIGVKDGRLVNAHEYQDAYGFTRIAGKRLEELGDAQRAQSPQTVARAKALVAELSDLWPSLVPGDKVDGDPDPSRLYGVAARIELAALGLD